MFTSLTGYGSLYASGGLLACANAFIRFSTFWKPKNPHKQTCPYL